MQKLRLQLTKGEEIRYISHLDYAGAMEKAIRRANLPAAYSEGFNPHMKIAFASALAVGITSESEYMDLELTEHIEMKQVIHLLSSMLPPGIIIKQAKYMPERCPAMMAVINLASYKMIIPLKQNIAAEKITSSIQAFLHSQECIFIKETPKGTRAINIREYIFNNDMRIICSQDKIELTLSIKITPTGSVKPSEVLQVLIESFALPVQKDTVYITRTGLFIANSALQCISPLEL